MVFTCFSANVVRHIWSQTMLGAIFAQIFRDFTEIFGDFVWIFRDFAKIFRDFASVFNKSKLLGGRLHPLHPHLLHHCSDVLFCRYQQSLSRYITCQNVCNQEPHATKRNLKWIFRNLKWITEDLLPWYYYTIKTNSKTIYSQVWHLAPAGSSVASPKIKKFRRGQNVWF